MSGKKTKKNSFAVELERRSFVGTETIAKKGGNSFPLTLASSVSVVSGSET